VRKFSFLEQAELTVFTDTTLGYEMVSRNKKVCIISARDQFLLGKEHRRAHFGIDEEVFENEGVFWLNRFENESQIYNKIESVYNLPLNKLVISYNENKDSLFFKDIDNSKFRNLLNEI